MLKSATIPRSPLAIGAFVLAIALAAAQDKTATAQENCTDTPEGRVCKIEQRLINGALVNPATQRALGAVSLTNDCSGTLLNQFWVLTADHCLSGGRFGGSSLPFGRVQITAPWTTQVATPTRFVRNWWRGRGLDIALIYLGAGDLGIVNAQPLWSDQLTTNHTLTKFGRGIHAFASQSTTGAQSPAVRDGRYRSARFTPSNVTSSGYTLPVNAAGQVGMGGDSGGPDRITVVSGSSSGFIGGIAGVQSTCHWTSVLPGQPNPDTPNTGTWNWVTGVDRCFSPSLQTIAGDIWQTIQEHPMGEGGRCSAAAAGCGIIEASSLLLFK